MTKHLDPDDLEEAIRECAAKARLSGRLVPSDIRAIALNFDIRPDALKQHFYSRYPSGVGKPLPLWAENEVRRVAEAVKASRERHWFWTYDGREAVIAGQRHTIIIVNKSRNYITAVDHASLEQKNYSFKKLAEIGIQLIQNMEPIR